MPSMPGSFQRPFPVTASVLRAALGATLLASSALVAHAADAPAKPLTAQQGKMGTCNAAAAGKKGDERKAFMADCLKAKPVAVKPTQQQKMAQCNKDSTGKKGDERKAFMSSCLRAG